MTREQQASDRSGSRPSKPNSSAVPIASRVPLGVGRSCRPRFLSSPRSRCGATITRRGVGIRGQVRGSPYSVTVTRGSACTMASRCAISAFRASRRRRDLCASVDSRHRHFKQYRVPASASIVGRIGAVGEVIPICHPIVFPNPGLRVLGNDDDGAGIEAHGA